MLPRELERLHWRHFLKEKQKMRKKRVAVVLTGGNIDNSIYQDMLNNKKGGGKPPMKSAEILDQTRT